RGEVATPHHGRAQRAQHDRQLVQRPGVMSEPDLPHEHGTPGGPVLRSGRPRLVIQEAWAWLTGTQLARAPAAALDSEHAAARAREHAAAGALRRRDARPVTADEESFTAAWRHAVRSTETSQVTAASSLEAIAAAGESAARACLRTLNVPGRQRHSERKQK